MFREFLLWATEEGKERCYSCCELLKNWECTLCGAEIKQGNYEHIRKLLNERTN
jgi:hypothetical protein